MKKVYTLILTILTIFTASGENHSLETKYGTMMAYASPITKSTDDIPSKAIRSSEISHKASCRQDIIINDGWTIKPMSKPQRDVVAEPVTLPHTWNAEYIEGTHDYNRETMVYQRQLEVTPDMRDKRLFLYFEGVNTVADVFVNRRSVGNHKGGYTAFCLEITDFVNEGANDLDVWASNGFRSDVLPISGDFNVYGGIHRPVHLIITGQDCFAPDYFASPGAILSQHDVSAQSATLEVKPILSLKSDNKGLKVKTSLVDCNGNTVVESTIDAIPNNTARLTIDNPALWHGRKAPNMYTVKFQLIDGLSIIDEIEIPTGFRSTAVDAELGFFLNGQPYNLYGVNRHDDFIGVGSALTHEHYEADKRLFDELQLTAIRLAHYPHGEPIYEMADTTGIVIWSEIPLCGPGGYLYTGYIHNIEDNARQTLTEMILQKGHHPSICFWGMFNELIVDEGKFQHYDYAPPFIRQLTELSHHLDPTRPTCCAICAGQQDYLQSVDLLAWNKYTSWYNSGPDATKFFDKAVANSNGTPIGLSEYGRGGSPLQHADPLYKYKLASTYHPEEHQTKCHEDYWEAIRDRKHLWWKTIWQFSDMQSSIKAEGDTPGRNDKGLVTYDRQTRKDVFYFYKAQWNPMDPMLHLCSARYTERDHAETEVRGYATTAKSVTLYLNGKKHSTVKPDSMHRVIFTGVTLKEGPNKIELRSSNGLTQAATWTLNK